MTDFDDALSGPCEICGEPGRLVVDPYDQDVDSSTVLRYLCDGCEQEAADDI
jgi:hypothetical protein